MARLETGILLSRSARVKRIVTCDPHAYNSLRNEYPAWDGHWEVVHHTQLIARLLAEITGDKPTVVLSDEKAASKRIATFAESDDRWMVAVRLMSSPGCR